MKAELMERIRRYHNMKDGDLQEGLSRELRRQKDRIRDMVESMRQAARRKQ